MQPANLDEFSARLAEEHEGLSRRLKQISEFVVENPQSLALDTAAVIAEKADIPASALVRFANHFDFNGFTELQKLYKDDLHQNYSDYNARIRQSRQSPDKNGEITAKQILNEFTDANIISLQALAQQLDSNALNEAIDLMDAAPAIHVCGVRRAFPVSMYLVYALNHMQVKCHAIGGLGMMHSEEAACVSKNETLIAITYKPYADVTQAVIKKAHDNGANVILITGDNDCPSAKYSNVVFNVKDAQVRTFRSLNSSMCLAQSLCIALGYRREENNASQ